MVFLHINKNNYDKYPNTNENPIIKLDNYIHNKKVFVLIFMEGCGPCNAVRPEWTKLKNVLKDYSNRSDIAIVDIDKDYVNKLKYIKNEPASFPTMRYISNGGENSENYEDSNVTSKDRSIDSFVEWIKSKEQKGGKTRKIIKTRKIRKGIKIIGGKWSLKYKRSINCRRPKGFSQKQHCKYGRKK
jgi:hypothetical protein